LITQNVTKQSSVKEERNFCKQVKIVVSAGKLFHKGTNWWLCSKKSFA